MKSTENKRYGDTKFAIFTTDFYVLKIKLWGSYEHNYHPIGTSPFIHIFWRRIFVFSQLMDAPITSFSCHHISTIPYPSSVSLENFLRNKIIYKWTLTSMLTQFLFYQVTYFTASLKNRITHKINCEKKIVQCFFLKWNVING